MGLRGNNFSKVPESHFTSPTLIPKKVERHINKTECDNSQILFVTYSILDKVGPTRTGIFEINADPDTREQENSDI